MTVTLVAFLALVDFVDGSEPMLSECTDFDYSSCDSLSLINFINFNFFLIFIKYFTSWNLYFFINYCFFLIFIKYFISWNLYSSN